MSAPEQGPAVHEVVDWLRSRPYYEGQISDHRVVDGRPGSFRDVPLESRVERALAAAGIDRLYAHQARAIEAVRDGDDVVLASPTASGKSLAYAVPAAERAIDRGATTLYVAPQTALIADQAAALSDLARDLGFGSGMMVDTYTGRLTDEERRAVRNRRPTVLLTTPDMLHYGILPHAHRLWDWFVSRLETVVLDEVHEYRGVFGSHVSLLCRRLWRVCDRFEADPQVVCCSATIGNPTAHASAVTGRSADAFLELTEDQSATGPTHWLLWNPPEYADPGAGGSGRRRSAHVETRNLFVDLVARGHQTVAFTRARQAAERYAADSSEELRQRGERDLADAVTAYQAALGRDRRTEIEAGLDAGDVRGVWSTSALELGVDIGGLDAVLLDGYPGTRMATFQRAGRAGRGTDPSLVAVVAGEDQLDQYIARHPDALFDEPPEKAVVNPRNDQLLPDHVRSAARETWLSTADEAHFGPAFPDLVADLEAAGELERRDTRDGVRWTYAGGGSPQHEMSLRTVSDREVLLLDERTDDRLASLPFEDALRDAHRGAIYHHQGTTYEVVELDLGRDVATLRPTRVGYYTRPLHEKAVRVETDLEERPVAGHEDAVVRFADISMRKRITGFERRDARNGEALGREELALPETTLETRALYFPVPADLEASMRAREGSFDGGIHAAEHALIATFPLALLCDRGDIGGVSTPNHPHVGGSAVFIYDGYPGGVGLVRSGFEDFDAHAERTRELVADCPCAAGCPACVQSPKCGNANEPLDKALAVHLLAGLSPGATPPAEPADRSG